MYKDFFGFKEVPFSIVPNARYMYLSHRHQEAMDTIHNGLGDGGGFAMLTGEVGTGKTTVAKAMLVSMTKETNMIEAGLILNPTFSNIELLEAICDEFSITYPEFVTLKELNQQIYKHLMMNHSNGIQTVLIIDEAQHLEVEVLEQLRLLTNLETDSRKLLKVLLIGQPELQFKLQTQELRQLAQRITGRYHLLPLDRGDIQEYIEYRLKMAGSKTKIFSSVSYKLVAKHTQGVPRLINLVCDRALQYAAHARQKQVSPRIMELACVDVMMYQAPVETKQERGKPSPGLNYSLSLLFGLIFAIGSYFYAPPSITGINNILAKQIKGADFISATSVELSLSESRVLDRVLSQGSSRSLAIRELYRMWGHRAKVSDMLCRNENENPYECETLYGSMDGLKYLDSPVVLELEVNDSLVYGVLFGFDRQNVQLLVANQRIQFPRAKLLDMWEGKYYLVWKNELETDLISRNDVGENVELLDQKLAKVLVENPLNSDIFGEKMESRVQLFQSWQEIEVDGVAGRETIKRLEMLSIDEVPKLQKINMEEI